MIFAINAYLDLFSQMEIVPQTSLPILLLFSVLQVLSSDIGVYYNDAVYTGQT